MDEFCNNICKYSEPILVTGRSVTINSGDVNTLVLTIAYKTEDGASFYNVDINKKDYVMIDNSTYFDMSGRLDTKIYHILDPLRGPDREVIYCGYIGYYDYPFLEMLFERIKQ